MKGYVIAILALTVANTAASLMMLHDAEQQVPVDDQAQAIRAVVHDELNRHRCHTLLYLGKQVKLDTIEAHCWRGHWAITTQGVPLVQDVSGR